MSRMFVLSAGQLCPSLLLERSEGVVDQDRPSQPGFRVLYQVELQQAQSEHLLPVVPGPLLLLDDPGPGTQLLQGFQL